MGIKGVPQFNAHIRLVLVPGCRSLVGASSLGPLSSMNSGAGDGSFVSLP